MASRVDLGVVPESMARMMVERSDCQVARGERPDGKVVVVAAVVVLLFAVACALDSAGAADVVEFAAVVIVDDCNTGPALDTIVCK